MSEQSYDDYDMRDLDREEQEVEKQYRHWKRKRDDLGKLIGEYRRDIRAENDPNDEDGESWREYDRQMDRCFELLARIEKRRTFIRAKRIEKEKSTAARQPQAGQRDEQIPAFSSALNAWARRVGRQQMPPATTFQVELTWELDGRQYVGYYQPSSGNLDVWMQVNEDSPGTRRIRYLYYRRVNTVKQMEQALAAERGAPS